jgi:hypothetical protein
MGSALQVKERVKNTDKDFKMVPMIGMIEKAHGPDFLAQNTRFYKGR